MTLLEKDGALTLLFSSVVCGLMGLPAVPAVADDVWLVHDGEAQAVLLIDTPNDPNAHFAADELQHHLELATGVRLPMVDHSALAALPAQTACVVIGAGPVAKELSVCADDLAPEAYRIRTVGRYLVFVGHDVGRPMTPQTPHQATPTHGPATTWAVYHYLDRELGVRWLWPGALGTHVPRRASVPWPQLDVTHRPAMEHRILRTSLARAKGNPNLPVLFDEATWRQVLDDKHRWEIRHQLGSRTRHRFTHAFHQTDPDIFAVAPDGQRRLFNPKSPDYAKFCLSNPKVAEMILAEWREAGSPDTWDVSPNDGSGFCTCDTCRAADLPPNQPAQDLWSARGKLTVRYVRFWNGLLERMRIENPKVQLTTFAYSAYRDPPPSGMKVHEGLLIQLVSSYNAYDAWRDWAACTDGIMLRPNWWHIGGPVPHLPIEQVGQYIEFARDHGMIGFDFDTLMGHWAVQGLNYYLVARLVERPDLGTEEVTAEYTSAFGSADDAVAAYLRYWFDYSKEVAYTVPAGGAVSINPNGLYERLVRDRGILFSSINGGYQSIAYLYTDERLRPAYALLDRAAKQAGNDTIVSARIEYLRDGLRHTQVLRDVLQMGFKDTRPKGTTRAQYDALAKQLRDVRAEMTPRHVIWGPSAYWMEGLRSLPVVEPEMLPISEPDDGL